MTKILRSGLLYYFLGIAFFFAVNHYYGIRVDGRLYLLQVIHNWHPERFVNDVPFMFGNQDSFSIFSPIYGFFIRAFSVDAGSEIFCFLMQLLWASAFLLLVRKWMSRFHCAQIALPFALGFFAMHAYGMPGAKYYCGHTYFWLVEPCSVARLLAEGLALAGLAFLFDANKYKALPFLILGTTVHPLMAGWTLPLWLFHHYPKTVRPVVVFAMLFPLTAFLHVGPFDIYPPDWLCRPLDAMPTARETMKYAAYLLFAFGATRMLRNKKAAGLASVSAPLFCIAFYLHYAGVYMQHIFIYQAQTYRMEWLCIVICSVLLASLLWERILTYRKAHVLTTHDFALVLFAAAVLHPEHWLVASLAGFFLAALKERKVARYTAVDFLFLILAVSLLFIQTYIQMLLDGSAPVVPFFRLSHLYKVLAWGIPLEWILSAFVVILLSLTSKRTYALFFGLFCVFPEFQLLPVIGLILCLLPKLKAGTFTLFVLLAMIYCVLNVSSIASEMTRERVAFIAIACALGIAIFVPRHPFIGFIVPMTLCLFFAAFNWDIRPEDQRLAEKQMNAFSKQTIFPQVKDRGRLFLYVTGDELLWPRTQFLTGAYVDEIIHGGEIFYKGQYKEAVRRKNALLFGADVRKYKKKFRYQEFVTGPLTDGDTLIAHVKVLCGMDEIDFFGTDAADMPFPLADSTYLSIMHKKVYLYSCPAKGAAI